MSYTQDATRYMSLVSQVAKLELTIKLVHNINYLIRLAELKVELTNLSKKLGIA